MLMRYCWGLGVGHRYSYEDSPSAATLPSATTPSDSDQCEPGVDDSRNHQSVETTFKFAEGEDEEGEDWDSDSSIDSIQDVQDPESDREGLDDFYV